MQFERMQFLEEKTRQAKYPFQMPDVCGGRLCGYAESFRELARSFQREQPSPSLDRRTFFEEERLRENCGVIAGHLLELADIMEQTADEMAGVEPLEEKTWRKLAHALRGRGFLLEGACRVPMALGGQASWEDKRAGMASRYASSESSGSSGMVFRHASSESSGSSGMVSRHAMGSQLGLSLRTDLEEGIMAREAEEVLESVLGKKYCLSLTSPEKVWREQGTYLFVEEPEYVALTGFARVMKGREEISGDNYSILQSERGTLTMLLSDGTGSGEDACRGSSWVLDLMEKLLETGYSPETALKMVNATAVTKGEEIGHPTLDLCQLDLERGDCMFCKAGGAVSFRKRDSQVEEIAGGQLPLGIFQDLEPQKQYLRLQEGDSIILMTDGVLEAFCEKGYEEAVRNYLVSMEDIGPREMAEKLMQLAIFATAGNVRDDMTILVATLWKNP